MRYSSRQEGQPFIRLILTRDQGELASMEPPPTQRERKRHSHNPGPPGHRAYQVRNQYSGARIRRDRRKHSHAGRR